MLPIFLQFRCHFKGRNERILSVDRSFIIKIALNFNSKVTEKVELLPLGTYNFQNLQNGTLVHSDYKHVKFPVLLDWIQNYG